jgi:5-formyltetrahydrofolate cyclo-ligase
MVESHLNNSLLNTKKEIRKHFLEKRLKIIKDEIEQKSNLVCFNAFANFYLLGRNIGLYSPIKNEVNPFILLNLGINDVSLPFIQNDTMLFKRWDKKNLLPNSKFHILEPLEIAEVVTPNVIIIPMLAFDDRRFRVGYGGGFYDKFLENFDGIKLGFAFDAQKYEKIPEEKFDIPLDYIITENNIY